LHLLTVGSNTVGVVQTFVTEDLEGAASVCPELVGGVGGAILDDYGGSVAIAGGGKALGDVAVGVDDLL